MPLILERMSGVVSIASPPAASVAAMISAASGCFAPSGEKAMISGSRPLSRASARIRSPSARNSPSARRAFLSRSERSSLTVALEKAVTWRGIILRRIAPRRAPPAWPAPSSAPSPSTWMTIESPIAAPSIIRPMIDVPQTRLPSFSTSILASISLARLTNLALARAWSPRLLVIATSRLTAVKPPLPRGFRRRPRYICGRPRARRRPRRGPASPCGRLRAG